MAGFNVLITFAFFIYIVSRDRSQLVGLNISLRYIYKAFYSRNLNSHEGATNWLQQFFEIRFHAFGDYEDAIVKEEAYLHHSIMTPMMNVGLIAPMQIIEEAIRYAEANNVPINSLEGFVRQILGWREFIRGMYQCKGSFSRTQNFWGFERKIPASFYDGTTGIVPIDHTIKQVLKTGHCHHIERLMVLGNFMLLCEFHPDEVYRWFMELFIDAYDWVMVPNVYGMSQFSDGGLFATKPYISGSNYLMKMSDHSKGEWQTTWDGLFWRFMHVNRDFFLSNPRLGMPVRTFDKMAEDKRNAHFENAEVFLQNLDHQK
jgi:deoxyribodipyrimidine photolyase-related protein